MRNERREDHATTRIKSSYIYRTATSKNAKDFLINHLIPTLPFKVKSIQVDDGSENEPYMSDNGMFAFQLDDLRARFQNHHLLE